MSTRIQSFARAILAMVLVLSMCLTPLGAYAEQELAIEDEEVLLDAPVELDLQQEEIIELEEYGEPEVEVPEEDTYPEDVEALDGESLEVGAQSIPAMNDPATGDYDDVFRVRGTAKYDLAKQVLSLVNRQRGSYGLSTLKMDKNLQQMAMQRAAECSVLFSHTRPDGNVCFELGEFSGENIAGGTATAADVMNLWMNSEGHRANILGGGWKSMGVGCVEVDGTYFWTQVFSGDAGSGTYAGTGSKAQTYAMDATYDTVGIDSFGFNLPNPPSSSIVLDKGKTYKLAVYAPNADWSYVTTQLHPSSFTWSSSNPKVATVSSAGVVKGVGAGTCTVTAKSVGGRTWKQRVRVPFNVTYQTHVQKVGWQGWKKNGQTSGTSGRSLRLEGIKIKLANQPVSGGIEYCTHVQKIGWQGWKKNGAMSGTSGRSLRLEAIRIRLTGNLAKQYDVYYRVHAQHFGWMGWAKNGAKSGTAGYAYRLEAIQIRLVKKGGTAPGSTSGAFRQR